MRRIFFIPIILFLTGTAFVSLTGNEKMSGSELAIPTVTTTQSFGTQDHDFVFLVFLGVLRAPVYDRQLPIAEIPYPEGYRNWTHIKTVLTGFRNVPQKKIDGFHMIYANEKAMLGYRTGHFPDGAIIVFDKYSTDTSNGVIKPANRKFINIMYKDAAAFKETGGWGFEEFTGDSRTEGRLSIQRQQACFNSCHASQRNTDFVFSKYDD